MITNNQLIIGPSNGWFYEQRVYSISRQQRTIDLCGANALEITLFYNDPLRTKHLLSRKKYRGLNYISLHLDNYSSEKSLQEQIQTPARIIQKYRPVTSVIHPTEIPEEFLRNLAIFTDLSIENMDINQKNGFRLEELVRKVKRYNLGFILDVQHAYEHDPEMIYARELFDALQEHLRHIHLSGENGQTNHALLHQADNTDVILDFTGRIISERKVPIILEGKYINSRDLKQEIEFVKRELGYD
jgi:hypothetical protein